MENGKESIYPSEKLADGGHPMLDNVKVKTKGLTKREYFAGLAMQGVLSHNHPMNPTPNQAEDIAKYAIGLADELLKQLEQ